MFSDLRVGRHVRDAAALGWLLDTLETVLVAAGAEVVDTRAGTYPLADKEHPAYIVEIQRALAAPC